MPSQPTFVLDGSTLAVIGALIGSLAGAITFLFRQLVAAKDSQIASLIAEIAAQRTEMIGQIEALKRDRDYFRESFLERSSQHVRIIDRCGVDIDADAAGVDMRHESDAQGRS